MSAILQRSFLAGRTMGQAVHDERQSTRILLASHGRYMAMHALQVASERTFFEFITMRKRILERSPVGARDDER